MKNGLCRESICCSNCISLKLNNAWLFLKRRWVGITKQWPNGYGAGFPIQQSQVQNCWVTPRSTQPFILTRLIKQVTGSPGGRVVKSKLSPHKGSVAWRQLNPINKKES